MCEATIVIALVALLVAVGGVVIPLVFVQKPAPAKPKKKPGPKPKSGGGPGEGGEGP